MIILYQFPLSHYCEKIRWALDYKKLNYEKVNLIPGPHFRQISKLPVITTSVPVILDQGKYVQGSSQIITYLDEKYPEKSLTPEEANLKEEAVDWESFADEEIAPHIRLCFYYFYLQHKKDLMYYLAYDSPWYKHLLLSAIFPFIKKKITEGLNISYSTFESSKVKLYNNLDQLTLYLLDRKFLVGQQFSRADLAIASVIAPIYQFEKYGLIYRPFPENFQRLAEELKLKSEWVPDIYKKYR